MIERAAQAVAISANGNPVLAVITVILFYFMFNIVEAGIENVVFGERFEHFLDPLFASAFIAFAAYTVWQCAIYNSR